MLSKSLGSPMKRNLIGFVMGYGTNNKEKNTKLGEGLRWLAKGSHGIQKKKRRLCLSIQRNPKWYRRRAFYPSMQPISHDSIADNIDSITKFIKIRNNGSPGEQRGNLVMFVNARMTYLMIDDVRLSTTEAADGRQGIFKWTGDEVYFLDLECQHKM